MWQVLLTWVNDVLEPQRIIVRDIIEDMYDGQVLGELLSESPSPPSLPPSLPPSPSVQLPVPVCQISFLNVNFPYSTVDSHTILLYDTFILLSQQLLHIFT